MTQAIQNHPNHLKPSKNLQNLSQTTQKHPKAPITIQNYQKPSKPHKTNHHHRRDSMYHLEGFHVQHRHLPYLSLYCFTILFTYFIMFNTRLYHIYILTVYYNINTININNLSLYFKSARVLVSSPSPSCSLLQHRLI